MKKLIMILLVAFSIGGCYVNVYDSVDNPQKETTIEILNSIDTTKHVSVIGSNIYVVDIERNLVVGQGVSKEYGAEPINMVGLLFLFIFLFFFGMLFGSRNT